MKRMTIIAVMALLIPQIISAQETLTLEQCRQLAITNNKSLQQEQVKKQMADYDKKIAAANYFPNISVKGAYLHNGNNISLLNDSQSTILNNMGTTLQTGISGKMTEITQKLMSNPAALMEIMSSNVWPTLMSELATTDVSAPLNAIGAQIDEALHLDIRDIGGGMVSLQQPVFAGGKIVASNKIAKLAQQLAQSRYDEQYSQVIVDVDNAYWQVVSISAKKDLAENYADLLQTMLRDIEAAVEEGVSTQADALSVKVKANEAEMLKTRSTNGLKLAKMLLCKQIGLPLDSQIVLADEKATEIVAPAAVQPKSMEEIYNSRPEIKQLNLAEQIYEKKVTAVRADMLPTIALTANYLYTNPNLKHGFSNSWAGTWNAGVVVSIPVFHGTEAMQKTRKAKAEATLYKLKYEDAKELINLQVSKLRCEYDEALERFNLTSSNLASAEENLRSAMLGFEEGVVPSNVAMAAQTAWLQAHSDHIDAGIELQMIVTNINKAEGNTL